MGTRPIHRKAPDVVMVVSLALSRCGAQDSDEASGYEARGSLACPRVKSAASDHSGFLSQNLDF